MARNRNKPWSEDDDRKLLEMKAAGGTSISMAAALKRSAAAIDGRSGVLRARAKPKRLR